MVYHLPDPREPLGSESAPAPWVAPHRRRTGYAGYVIDRMDDMSSHNSRGKGHAEVFTALLERLVAGPSP